MAINKLSVTFSTPHNEVHVVETASSLTASTEVARSQLWFSQGELYEIKCRAYQLTQHMRAGMNSKFVELKFDGDCARGLEYFADPRYQRAMKKRRSNSRKAVIHWPKKHRRRPSVTSASPEYQASVIAHTYSLISQDAVRHALEQASVDRQYVTENATVLDNLIRCVGLTKTSTTTSTPRPSLDTRSESRKRKNLFVSNNEVFNKLQATTCSVTDSHNTTTCEVVPVFRRRQYAAIAC